MKRKDATLLAIMSEINKSAQKPDMGFLTAGEWAERWGFTRNGIHRLLRRSVKSGIMEIRTFRRKVANRVMPIPHYGLRKK